MAITIFLMSITLVVRQYKKIQHLKYIYILCIRAVCLEMLTFLCFYTPSVNILCQIEVS